MATQIDLIDSLIGEACAPINQVFHTKTGKNLAKILVAHIARTEPHSNTDECIAAINDSLGQILDKITHYPVSAFHDAEVCKKLQDKRQDSRYIVQVA